MFEQLEARAARIAERRAHEVAARIADSIDIGGIAADAVEGGVELTGRGLIRRWINDARLRWIAGWAA